MRNAPPAAISPSHAMLLDSLGTGGVLVDAAMQVHHANARALRQLRFEAGSHALRSLLSFASDAIPEKDFEAISLATAQPLLCTAKRLPDKSGLTLITLTDLTRQKQLEQSLRDTADSIAQISDTVIEQATELQHTTEHLEHVVSERTRQLRDANMDAIYMLALASEAKDHDTGRHLQRVRSLAQSLALEVGMSDLDAREIGYSAMLHDVGKLHVPDEILKKPGKLTDAERGVMEQHTTAGQRILADTPFFAIARDIARSHHENFDGSGYPDRAAAEQISLPARIVHLVDVFDALTSPRIYKHAWSLHDAMSVIDHSSGKMFDPQLVKAFTSLHDRGLVPPPV